MKGKTLSEKVNKGWLDNTDEDLFSYKDVKEAIKRLKEKVKQDYSMQYEHLFAIIDSIFGEELSK